MDGIQPTIQRDAEGGSVTPVPSAAVSDLRVQPVDDLLDRVERRLEVLLDRGTVVRKRRSCGARTDRDTWVRIERRGLDRIDSQGWNGTECAAALGGIAKPTWYWCEGYSPVRRRMLRDCHTPHAARPRAANHASSSQGRWAAAGTSSRPDGC